MVHFPYFCCNISNLTVRTGLDFKCAQFDPVRGKAEVRILPTLDHHVICSDTNHDRLEYYLHWTSTILSYLSRS
jgi:hypothetical protein